MSERRLTIMGHLEELRRRLIISVVALVATTLVSCLFANHIFQILLRPAGGLEPVFIEVTEMLGAYIRVSLVTGLVLASPLMLYEAVMFIVPGLMARERRYLYVLLPGMLISFATGVVFCYFVLLPPALNFLLTIGSGIATPQIRIGNYISVTTNLLFWVGLTFETPLVMWFLARLGILSPALLSRHRRHALVGAFVLGAIITPTFDPVNQALVALPIIVLYEVGILLARTAYRR